MNYRKEAIEAIIKESQRNNQSSELLHEALVHLTDTNLFSLYFQIFGHVVGC